VVAQSSLDDHMLLEGRYVPEVMGSHTDWSSDGGLGCDGMRANGSSRVLLGLIRGTEQVREVLRE